MHYWKSVTVNRPSMQQARQSVYLAACERYTNGQVAVGGTRHDSADAFRHHVQMQAMWPSLNGSRDVVARSLCTHALRA